MKASDAVVEYLLGEFLAGRIRPGDRIDLDAVCEELEVSRSPVREALLTLERDGTVRMPFQRGAFMNEITEAHIREGFTLYAMLSGLSARSAAPKMAEADFAEEIRGAAGRAIEATLPQTYELEARQVRRLLNRAGAGPHLKALLRTFNGLVVAVSGLAIEAGLGREQQQMADELAALESGDPVSAGAAAVHHVVATGDAGIAVLRRRGVLADTSDREEHRQLASIELVLDEVLGRSRS